LQQDGAGGDHDCRRHERDPDPGERDDPAEHDGADPLRQVEEKVKVAIACVRSSTAPARWRAEAATGRSATARA